MIRRIGPGGVSFARRATRPVVRVLTTETLAVWPDYTVAQAITSGATAVQFSMGGWTSAIVPAAQAALGVRLLGTPGALPPGAQGDPIPLTATPLRGALPGASLTQSIPTYRANIEAWLGYRGVVHGGGLVNSWTGQTAGTVASNGAANPSYTPNDPTFNGHDSIGFNNQWLQCNGLATLLSSRSSFTALLVGAYEQTLGSRLWYVQKLNNPAFASSMYRHPTTGTGFVALLSDGTSRFVVTSAVDTSVHVVAQQYAGSAPAPRIRVYSDGVQISGPENSPPIPPMSDVFAQGAIGATSAGSSRLVGSLAGMFFFGHLDVGQIQTVTPFLLARYRP